MVKKNYLSSLDAEVSRLGFGCMRFPTTDDGKIDRAKSNEMLGYAYDHGVNYYDTAWGYHNGESQIVTGEFLSGKPRESFYLATKLPLWLCKEESDNKRIFEEQLTNCRVDFFDFYLAHAFNADRYEEYVRLNTHEYLTEMKRQGKIKRLGFSYHGDLETLRKLLDEFEWDFVQLQVNYFDYAYPKSNARQEYEMVTTKGLPCVCMEPVRGGFLANLPDSVRVEMDQFEGAKLSPAAWALRWCMDQENMRVILSGMSTLEQVKENVEVFSGDNDRLTDAERAMIGKVTDTLLAADTVPCTACRYCMDCPFGVDIPGVFETYNQYRIFQTPNAFGWQWDNMVKDGHGPEQCTRCGACEPMCPQNIAIPDQLERICAEVAALKK
ncbi:MAG: aldo/keto reductase [Oscillospiraceae bacterium]